jgi:hypothetical protein
LVKGVVEKVAHTGMDSYHCLEGIEGILGGVFLIVDIGFGDDVVLFVSAHEVDVFLSVDVDGGLEAEMFIDGVLELLTEVGDFIDEGLEFGALQGEEYTGGDAANGDTGEGVVEEVAFAEVFSFTEEGDAEFLTVESFA